MFLLYFQEQFQLFSATFEFQERSWFHAAI